MKNTKIEIVPSLLSADFFDIKKSLSQISKLCNSLHLDVMDGHFVPNISFGQPIIKSIRKATNLKLEAHLMIYNADFYLDSFIKAGSDLITIHYEAFEDREIKPMLSEIREKNISPGISINPSTDWRSILEFIPMVDLVLVMTVNPGFSGQKFIENCVPKIKSIRNYIEGIGANVDVEVDGGINIETGKIAVKAGANKLVVGNSIFSAENPEEEIQKMIEAFGDIY